MSQLQRFGNRLLETLGALWCRLMHHEPMWPIRGNYECRICGRRFPVPWENEHLAGPVTVGQEERIVESGA